MRRGELLALRWEIDATYQPQGEKKCRFHGGKSTGPCTAEGRQKCAAVKTVRGFETRKEREERAEGMRRLRNLEGLGFRHGIMSGLCTPGRKPNNG